MVTGVAEGVTVLRKICKYGTTGYCGRSRRASDYSSWLSNQISGPYFGTISRQSSGTLRTMIDEIPSLAEGMEYLSLNSASHSSQNASQYAIR
jgi:hypothetical protein